MADRKRRDQKSRHATVTETDIRIMVENFLYTVESVEKITDVFCEIGGIPDPELTARFSASDIVSSGICDIIADGIQKWATPAAEAPATSPEQKIASVISAVRELALQLDELGLNTPEMRQAICDFAGLAKVHYPLVAKAREPQNSAAKMREKKSGSTATKRQVTIECFMKHKEKSPSTTEARRRTAAELKISLKTVYRHTKKVAK